MKATVQSDHRTFGAVLDDAGVSLDDIFAVRHTYQPDGLPRPEFVTPQRVLAYTREQGHVLQKVPLDPPPLWFVFMADGGLRSRLVTVYENHGPLPEEESLTRRRFDLRPSDLLIPMRRRLVVEWSRDAVNWTKTGQRSANFPVVEITEPASAPFPSFS